MYAAQARGFRRPNTFSEIVEQNHTVIRSKVLKLEDDRLLKHDIDHMVELVENRSIIVNL